MNRFENVKFGEIKNLMIAEILNNAKSSIIFFKDIILTRDRIYTGIGNATVDKTDYRFFTDLPVRCPLILAFYNVPLSQYIFLPFPVNYSLPFG